MSDEKLTKLTGKVFAALSAQVRHLADEGLIDPEQLRLTIAARAKKAKALVDSGMSTREAAAELGISQTTVMRDLNQNGSESEPERFANDRDERREEAILKNEELAAVEVAAPAKTYETIVIDPPWPMVKIERDVRPNQVAFDYPTMDENALRKFGETLSGMAGADCHLFMWTTQKHLPFALALVEHYGFRYVLVAPKRARTAAARAYVDWLGLTIDGLTDH